MKQTNLKINPIKLNQKGTDVYLLHQVLSAFGLAVSSKETLTGVAEKETQKKVTLLQRQLHISPLDNTPLLDAKTIAILEKAMVDNGMISSKNSFRASGNVKSSDGKVTTLKGKQDAN